MLITIQLYSINSIVFEASKPPVDPPLTRLSLTMELFDETGVI